MYFLNLAYNYYVYRKKMLFSNVKNRIFSPCSGKNSTLFKSLTCEIQQGCEVLSRDYNYKEMNPVISHLIGKYNFLQR